MNFEQFQQLEQFEQFEHFIYAKDQQTIINQKTMPNNKKPLLSVETDVSLTQKVGLVVGMVCAFLVGVVMVSTVSINKQPVAVTQKQSETYEINFLPESLIFSKLSDYDTVNLPDCINTRFVGSPQLPHKVLHFMIPKDKEVSKIQIVEDKTQEIEGEYNIYPVQESVKLSEEPKFTPPDQDIYSLSQYFPDKIIEISTLGSLGGIDISSIRFYPLQYNPVKKNLLLHTNLKFKLIYKERDKNTSKVEVNQDKRTILAKTTIKELLKKVVFNSQEVDKLFATPLSQEDKNTSVDYLIITNDELISSGVFDPLLASKQAKNYTTLIQSVSWIEINYTGIDTPEKIRNYIKNLYQNNGLIYVLLGGDTNIVPVRYAYPFSCDNMGCFDPPSDLYYSDLDGTWNDDGDNFFGEPEDNIDLYPDVFVGRAPVENQTEVETFVNKTLTFESNFLDYNDTALFIGTADKGDTGGITKDLIDDLYMPPEYDPITKLYQRDGTENRENVLAALNLGYFFVNHIDHGAIGSLAIGPDSISIDDIDNLTNAPHFSILWSCGCFPAAINYDCFAEHWVTNPNGGGIAFIGNSHFGIHPESDQMLEPEFYKSIFWDGIYHIGQTLADSKITFIPEVNSSYFMRHAIYELNLLGDPEISLIFEDSDLPIARIWSPSIGQKVFKNTEIVGTARRGTSETATFSHYTLEWGIGESPVNWSSEGITLTNGGLSEMSNGILGTWDVQNLADGLYTLKLEVFDNSGQSSSDQNNVIVNNVYISSPPNNGTILDDVVNIEGSVVGNEFLNYTIEWGQEENPSSWSTQGITLTNGGLNQVEDGVLAVWDTNYTSQSGFHKLKIVANFNGYQVEETYLVYFPRTLVVDQGGGGDYTTIQEAVDVAHDYDTISIKPDNYSGDWIKIEDDLDNLVITAFDPNNPPIINQSLEIKGKEITVSNLIFESSYGYHLLNINYGIIFSDVDKTTKIINNTFNSSIINIQARSSLIENNTFQDNTSLYVSDYTNTGLIRKTTIINNVFEGTNIDDHTSLTLVSRNSFPGQQTDPLKDVLVEGNMFKNASLGDPLSAIISGYNLEDATIRNNVFIDNPQGSKFDEMVGDNNYYYKNSHINSPVRTDGSFDENIHLDKDGEGNYWSDYDTPEEGCVDSNGDGFCDEPYHIPATSNTPEKWDYHPFVKPVCSDGTSYGQCNASHQICLNGQLYLSGDVNNDGVVNPADIAYLTNYLFVGGPAPEPLNIGDVNSDGAVNPADIAYLINYLFVGGPAPCQTPPQGSPPPTKNYTYEEIRGMLKPYMDLESNEL